MACSPLADRLLDGLVDCHGMGEMREWTIEEFVADARPPSDDDVPMTLDWTPLDTREKLIAYLEEINRRRPTSHAG